MQNLKTHHHFAIVSLLVFGVVSVWTWGSVVFASDTQITVQIGPPDACKNIPGYQQEIPEGMQVENGNCFSPPPPPAEPCTAQSTTTCEAPAPATDYCQNIDGVQGEIPAGMRRDDEDTCFTPARLAQPELPPSTSVKPVKPGLLNFPNLGHADTDAPGDSPLSFLAPQVAIVILTAAIAVSSLALVRYHHHRIGFSSHRRA